LDSMVYQGEKILSENAEKISDSNKEALNSYISDAKEVLESGDSEKIQAMIDTLNTSLQAAATEMYAATQEAPPGAESQPAEDDDIIDAEFEETSTG